MNNRFGFEKDMEILEQGGNVVKQQVKTTTQAAQTQVTGQQPNFQNPNQPQPKLDGFKEQVLGKSEPKPMLSGVKAQILGANGQPQPQSDGVKDQILGTNGHTQPTGSGESQVQTMQKNEDQ